MPIEPNSRMRVTHVQRRSNLMTPPPVEGLWVNTRSDTIILRIGDAGTEYAIALAFVKQLEVLQRRSNAGYGALVGMASGGLLGAFVGFSSGDDCSGSSGFLCITPEDAGLLFGVSGAVAGLALGYVVGAMSSDERWYPVFLERASTTAGTRHAGTYWLGLLVES